MKQLLIAIVALFAVSNVSAQNQDSETVIKWRIPKTAYNGQPVALTDIAAYKVVVANGDQSRTYVISNPLVTKISVPNRDYGNVSVEVEVLDSKGRSINELLIGGSAS